MTTNNIKEAAPLIWAEIEQAQNILLHCHPSPDQDSIGSSLAMKLALEGKGKKVTMIIGDSEIPKWTKFLPSADTIVAKNYFEVDINQFDLFLILDSNAWNRVSDLGPITPPATLRTVVIDHHMGEGCGEINLIVTDHPATSSILTELFREWGVSLNRGIATCLIVGLHADTGGFKYPRTTAHIFNLAAELVEVAPDFSQTLNKIYGLSSLGSRRIMGHVLLNLELFADGKLAVGSMTQADFDKLGAKPEEADNTGLSTMIRDIEGVEVGVTIIERGSGVIKVSSRAADGNKYDVAAAMKSLGGGGHKAAAGVTINGEFTEVKDKVIKELTTLLQ